MDLFIPCIYEEQFNLLYLFILFSAFFFQNLILNGENDKLHRSAAAIFWSTAEPKISSHVFNSFGKVR